MEERMERKRLSILRCLAYAPGALSSEQITEQLAGAGNEVSERTVRLYLHSMDKEGLTRYVSKHGRVITPIGRHELTQARIFDRVGFLSARIDQLTYGMTFDLAKRTGRIVVNLSLVPRCILKDAWPLMKRVYDAGFSMGKLVTLFAPGEQIGEIVVPKDCVGIGTVCSVTLNGILLRHGIPVASKFGGLLEVQRGRPLRFVAVISYNGTTLDPLEIFIRSGMTDYERATRTGSGRIGASFREVPSASRERMLALSKELKIVGLDCIMELGLPGQPLREIPVDQGGMGAIVIGGLNPIAILEEHGMKVVSKALSGLIDFSGFFWYTEMPDHIAKVT
jgi:repressor of nif and glnA expression